MNSGNGYVYLLPVECEDVAAVLGCTDENAENYDAAIGATLDDGSCIFWGCTNPEAYNYNSQATVDDGSCTVLVCDYDGEWVVEFEKENYADWNLPENRDIITPTCEITRQNQQPLYNYVTQSNYYDNQYDSNIEWKQGGYDEPGAWYPTIANAFGNYMNGIVGQTATLHIIDSDLYFEFEFSFWQSNGNGGGFAYTRTYVPVNCEELPIALGCMDSVACNYDSSASVDDGSCDYVSCADDCGIPYGDNSSCSGCTNPEADNYDSTASIDDNSCVMILCDEDYISSYNGLAVVEFSMDNYADWNLPENRDFITETCELTRQSYDPIYNYAIQNSYTDNVFNSNIQWKMGGYDEPEYTIVILM